MIEAQAVCVHHLASLVFVDTLGHESVSQCATAR